MQQQPNSQPNFPNPDMSSEELQEFFNDPENQARIKVPRWFLLSGSLHKGRGL